MKKIILVVFLCIFAGNVFSYTVKEAVAIIQTYPEGSETKAKNAVAKVMRFMAENLSSSLENETPRDKHEYSAEDSLREGHTWYCVEHAKVFLKLMQVYAPDIPVLYVGGTVRGEGPGHAVNEVTDNEDNETFLIDASYAKFVCPLNFDLNNKLEEGFSDGNRILFQSKITNRDILFSKVKNGFSIDIFKSGYIDWDDKKISEKVLRKNRNNRIGEKIILKDIVALAKYMNENFFHDYSCDYSFKNLKAIDAVIYEKNGAFPVSREIPCENCLDGKFHIFLKTKTPLSLPDIEFFMSDEWKMEDGVRYSD
ncbi:hypothetical protein Dip510_001342 [Elusimicrobium posterum]|uniref:hypothetical protein n=1 Tax=Elusimicrobium posterum TaxID=3116653 RepID=UPI003C7892F6